ncbi:MAG: DJ-1/PfpI/YhbO family deglycase/protease [Bacteroidales bacterium]
MKINRLTITGLIIGMLVGISGCSESEVKSEIEETLTSEDMKKVAVITGEGFQDAEAYMPIGYLTNRGVDITVIGVEKKEVKSYNSDFTIMIEKTPGEVSTETFDALLLPGGKAPAKLREHEAIVEFVKDFYESGKPVAAICHAPQILIRAGVMEGKTATSYKSVKEEMLDAGVDFVDDAPVTDGNLITARNPDDLAAFSKALWETLQ